MGYRRSQSCLSRVPEGRRRVQRGARGVSERSQTGSRGVPEGHQRGPKRVQRCPRVYSRDLTGGPGMVFGVSQRGARVFPGGFQSGLSRVSDGSQRGPRGFSDSSRGVLRCPRRVFEWSQKGHRGVPEWSQTGPRGVAEGSNWVGSDRFQDVSGISDDQLWPVECHL